jgi:hypothetical protein
MVTLELYEDLIELELDRPSIKTESLHWVQYNPRKPINRFGCSITSLDGLDLGVPDLDSLVEYNKLNQTKYVEKDFQTKTKHSVFFEDFLGKFTVGRSHFLKLSNGGYFPWHRDNDLHTFRIIYTVSGCENTNLVWIHDNQVLNLENKKWYYINTKKKHTLFAFNDSIMAVFNVLQNESNINNVLRHSKIR